MMKKYRLGNKGIMSILSLILVLCIVIIASGFLTIMQRTMALDEVQGIMDTSGLLALRQGVDEDLWRQEIIEIDVMTVKAQFRNMVEKSIVPSESGIIEDYSIDSIIVHSPNSPGLSSLGIPDGQRDQYYLETLVTLKLDRNSQFGPSSNVVWGFYDFFYGNSGRYQGITREPGSSNEDVLLVRSVTRLVLR